ncbi:MAG: copper resistance protein NlpE [Duncaniella sp.]|nr:copper resistance protein NlpE [Duncaniella sp.]
MKKIVLMAGAALAMMSMVACSGDNKCGSTCDNKCDGDVVFTGVLPAADAEGVRYTLALDCDDDCTKGDYKLVETYIKADTVSALGYKDAASFASEGDFTVVKNGDKTYLKLVKDAKDSSAQAADNLYFVVDSDSTITMTNAQFEVSETPGMNYTLQKVK